MKIVGIHGRARSGKDTLAHFLVEHHGFLRIALADPLRRFVSDITGLDESLLMDSVVKEQPIDWLGGKSPRQLMQTLGTEWGRTHVDENVWLAVAQRKIDQARRRGYAGVVIPDVRFDNEAQWVRQLGGHVVRLVRDDAAPVADHASERGVADHLIDTTIDNNGPLVLLAHWAEALAI